MTTITTLPTPPSRDEPTTFTARADAFLGALPTFGTECNAVASEVNAAAAQASAAVSILSMDGYTGSTTTSFTIAGSGSQTVTTQTGRLWVSGTVVQLSSTASPANYVVGQVSSYSGNTLTFTIQKSSGSGTFADWRVGLASSYILANDALINGVTVGRGGSSTSTAVGYQALSSSVASGDVAIGYQALSTPTTNAGGSVAVGYQAAMAPNGSNSVTAVGYRALTSIAGGVANTAVGSQALVLATSGSRNTALGNNAATSVVSTSDNTALGHNAFSTAANYSGNTSVGSSALATTQYADKCVAVGYRAGGLNTRSAYTPFAVAVGVDTGLLPQSTSVGYCALSSLPDGATYNTAVGVYALSQCTQSNANMTALGANSLNTFNSAWNNITAIGANSTVTAANQVSLGDSANVASTYTNNGSVYSRSDTRDKADIRDTVLGLDFIKAIRPVDYKWDHRGSYMPERPADLPEYANDDEKAAHALALEAWQTASKWENLQHDGTHKRNRYHHGVIAQEVQELINTTGVDFGGFQDHKISGGDDVLSIGYSEFIAPLIKAVQELAAQNAELSARIAVLEAK